MPTAEPGKRRLDIQGLRAVAVLVVVAFHAGFPVPGGFVGVDVFFVISGFVITLMLGREWATTGSIGFGRFYLRRFKRLTPALALMITVVLLVSVLLVSPLDPQQTTAKTAVGAMLIIANVVIARTTGGYFDASAEGNPFLNTWTLSVEEQFYLVFPLILFIGWRLARSKRFKVAPIVLVGAAAVVSFLLALAGQAGLTFPGSGLLLGFYSPVVRAWEFAVGALLALAVARIAISSRVALAAGGVGAALLAASLWVISGTTPFPSAWTLLPVAGALLLILAGTNQDNPVTRFLATRPMVKIGDWSYSVYLWHWPLIVLATTIWADNVTATILAALISFAPAIASYVWVEQPFRRIRTPTRSLMAGMVAGVLVVPIVVASAMYVAAQKVYWIPNQGPLVSAVRTDHIAGNCTIELFTAETCRRNTDSAGAPIYLVGDSTAGHFAEAAIGASDILQRPLSIIVLNGCPFKDVYLLRADVAASNQTDCRQGYDDTDAWLRDQPPGLVVISELNSWYRQEETKVGLTPATVTNDPADRAQALKAGLTATVDGLQEAGHEVVLVQAAPDFEDSYGYSPHRCSVLDLRAGSCASEMPLAYADEIQKVERRSVAKVADTTGARIWDPRPFLCSDGTCRTERDGVVLYRDAFHISVSASEMLSSQFAQAVDPSY